ncbi:MAG: hypothetical protein COA73_05155 [Candidatus Hydrogenedentota bacterium]|nr:MAG: hypothetical protein COA73_05155 [Candidatus Hydrogenedentota bacterium]
MKTKLEYQMMRKKEKEATEHASEILEANGMMSAPIDPFEVAAAESRGLKLVGADLKEHCDGQLEYDKELDLFILFYNTKYDVGLPEGRHHPRTRFSIAHELGHFFLENHRAYLMQSGSTHSSQGEFASKDLMEREADAFAAGLLMPLQLFREAVNQDELSIEYIRTVADIFETSFVSTAIRSVQNSDFPCELVGIRDGEIAWRFRPSGNRDPLKEGGLYRSSNGKFSSKNLKKKWQEFEDKIYTEECLQGTPQDWFKLYGPVSKEIDVWEHYLSVPSMNTLLVLLTVSEEELFETEEEEYNE